MFHFRSPLFKIIIRKNQIFGKNLCYNKFMFKYYGKYAPYLFLLPAGLLLIVFFFIPFFQTVILSFQDYTNNIYAPVFAGLQNYTELFKNPIFYKVMLNTFIYLIVAVPILAILPLFLAVLLNQKSAG